MVESITVHILHSTHVITHDGICPFTKHLSYQITANTDQALHRQAWSWSALPDQNTTLTNGQRFITGYEYYCFEVQIEEWGGQKGVSDSDLRFVLCDKPSVCFFSLRTALSVSNQSAGPCTSDLRWSGQRKVKYPKK